MNSLISYDAAANRPSDYEYMFKPATLDDLERQRKGYSSIYYNGRYVCSIDTGMIPEFKVWEMEDGMKPIDMADVGELDTIAYVEILETDPFYNAAVLAAERHDDHYEFREDGKLFRYEAMRFCKIPGRVLSLGWRHTFEALIRHGIPGINRDTLGEKFGVNMHMVPTGQLEDIQRALFEE